MLLLGLLSLTGSIGCARSTAPGAASAEGRGRKAEFERALPVQRTDLPAGKTPSSGKLELASGRQVPDAWIVVGVRREMERIDGVPESRIEVASNDGIVTLAGTASTPLARALLLERVLGVDGVRAIVNRVEVVGENATDEEIRGQVERRLRYFPITEHQAIRVTVNDGVLRLDGSLRTPAERALAERTALAVPGVRAVDNYIVVTRAEPRKDALIAKEVVRRVTERAVPGDQIAVRVSSAAVFLSGTVKSESERRMLRESAWVPGVRAVYDADVSVVRDRSHARAPGAEAPSDSEVTRAVLDTVPLDPRLFGSSIGVSTQGGTVTLEGSVRDEAARIAAERNAAATRGVRDVKNRLIVEPRTPVADAAIQREVSSRLQGHPGISPGGIKVFVDNGWVLLTGRTDSLFEKNNAEGTSESVKGVVGVINRIAVAPRAEIARRDDAAIERDIVQRLARDPRIGEGLVEVQVRGGVASLSGRLPSYDVYDAVLENVYQVLPPGVENRLQVDERPMRNDLR